MATGETTELLEEYRGLVDEVRGDSSTWMTHRARIFEIQALLDAAMPPSAEADPDL